MGARLAPRQAPSDIGAPPRRALFGFQGAPGSGGGGRTRGRGHASLFPAPLWAALDVRGPPEKGVQAARAALCPRFRRAGWWCSFSEGS